MSSPGHFGWAARTFAAVAASTLLLVVAVPGCSSKESPAGCDSAKCAAGNKCLPLGGEVKCRKVCSSNSDPATSCPAGYTCVAHADSEPFCEQNVNAPAPGPKQWGTRCNPAGGIDNNPDCDAANGFSCFAQGPNDGDAYCTRYECTSDRECAAGFFCGDANVAPNAKTAQRTVGQTVKVCQRRAYCSPCTADFDCPTIAGNPQRCIQDDDGNGYCSQECDQTRACNLDAKCVAVGDVKVCYPRAGRCKGDGELCSPCRSDADCPKGACVTGLNTNEKSCAVKAPAPCAYDDPNNGKNCPPPGDGAKPAAVRCLGSQVTTDKATLWPEVPKDMCHGMYGLGDGADVGCWTPAR